jgi:hypothetical protein
MLNPYVFYRTCPAEPVNQNLIFRRRSQQIAPTTDRYASDPS